MGITSDTSFDTIISKLRDFFSNCKTFTIKTNSSIATTPSQVIATLNLDREYYLKEVTGFKISLGHSGASASSSFTVYLEGSTNGTSWTSIWQKNGSRSARSIVNVYDGSIIPSTSLKYRFYRVRYTSTDNESYASVAGNVTVYN